MAEDPHAPRIILSVEGDRVDERILTDVSSVTYENSLYLTDEMKITLMNHEGRYSDAVMWGHGNEVELWMGYGQDMSFIGRTELTRHIPTFPSDGIMTFELRGLDKSWRMKKKPLRVTGGKTPKRRKEIKSHWKGPLGGWLKKLAKKYGFKLDVTPRLAKINENFLQKRGQTDFQTFQALANFHRASGRVEYRLEDGFEGSWYLVFRDLDEVQQQDFYTFRYFDGPESTVIEVSFEFGLEEQITEVQAFFWDPTYREPSVYKTKKYPTIDKTWHTPKKIIKTKRVLVRRGRRVGAWRRITESDYKQVYTKVPKAAKIETETSSNVSGRERRQEIRIEQQAKAAGLAVGFRRKLKKWSDPFHRSYRSQMAKIQADPNPTKLRLQVGGHAIEILTRPFRSVKEARDFIKAWIKRNRDNFILAKGKLPGIKIKAGETHAIEGPALGKRYSGFYYFSNVTQSFGEDGWITEFQARKVITPAWSEDSAKVFEKISESKEK